MRLSLRTATVGLLLASGLTPLPSLEAAPAARGQRLAGTTVMDVSGPSVTTVSLPRAVRFWHPYFDPDRPDFEITGGRDFVAFALMKLDPGGPPTGLLGGRLPEGGDAEPFLTHVGLEPSGPEWTGFWKVPRGRYRFYVFAEEPVRLSLSLEGLRGRTTLRPAAPARYEVKEPQRLAAPATSLYSAGATGSMDGRVAQLQVLWTRESAHLSSQTGFCWYDDAPPDPATAYLPGCPFADSQDVVEVTGDFIGESFWVATGLRLPVPTGNSGQGMWFASAAAVRDVGRLTAWLDLGLE